MVNNMKSLFKLWQLKINGTIRNLFKRKLSGIFTIIMILCYGLIFISLFTVDSGQIMTINIDVHMSILLLIGFLALMLFSSLMQSKKALFYGEDAFYLFTGPFTRRQIMSYLTFQTIMQSLILGLFAQFILAVFVGSVSFSPMFIILTYFTSTITILIFLILTDYIYVLSIGDDKYRIYSKLIPLIMVGFVVIIIIILYIQTGNYQTLFSDFIQSDIFYAVPVFGWLKLVLIAYVEKNYVFIYVGFSLLVGALVILYLLFINYKGDFYEQALQDSLDLSKRIKAAKAGNQDALRNVKVKKGVSSKFRQGAYAIMSKNILLMKKTNIFISISDLISIGIYMVITIIINLGFGMFIYMMVFWVFSLLQNSDLSKELKNYQIYLIPDKPFNKLLATIIPSFIKIFLVTSISFIMMGIYYQASIITILSYLLNILGYTSIFISASVLSVRILKSRSSPMFENFMKMLVTIICAVPGIVAMIIIYRIGGSNTILMSSYLTLGMNFVISFLILFGCRNMMNGRELKSE